jgi:hypothetical protein
LPISNQKEEVMRKFALLAASSAGALLMILVQVDAMTFSNTAGARDVLPSADAVKPEQVRWRRMRNCQPRYYEPPPYYSSSYQPWPYYPYYNFGTGQSRFGFAH